MVCCGCYMDPDNASTIDTVVASISQRPREADLMVARNANDDLAAPEGNTRDKWIAALATTDLEDMSADFLPWHKLWLR